MYRLAAVHSVTDAQTDKRQYHANSRSYCVAVQLAKNDKKFSLRTVEEIAVDWSL